MLVNVTPLTPEEREQLAANSGGSKFAPSDRLIPVRTPSGFLMHVRRADIVEGTE